MKCHICQFEMVDSYGIDQICPNGHPPLCGRCGKECILVEAGIGDWICPDENCKVDLREFFRKCREKWPEPETQESVHKWCKDTFPAFKGLKGRATALLEEAVELGLASGMSKEEIASAVAVPLQKAEQRTETESAEGEIGDVLICVYAFAGEGKFSAQEAMDKKMRMNRSRPPEYYLEKTKEKKALGMKLDD